MSDNNKYTESLAKNKKKNEDKKKSVANGGGPIGKIFIFLIKDIFIDGLLIGFYNTAIDIFNEGFAFVDEMFFSDFKGVLAGKFKSKKGTCFEYTYFRYFITIMLPPMGVFLARGLAAWYNIAICAFLCMIYYFPGLIYALIVIQSAPYANRYQEMKRDKLKKAKEEQGKTTDTEATPLFFFGLAILIVCVGLYVSLGVDPNEKPISSLDNLIEYFQPVLIGPQQYGMIGTPGMPGMPGMSGMQGMKGTSGMRVGNPQMISGSRHR
jgi:uncharacterized membrane protein YqaE (UPF0057 family)